MLWVNNVMMIVILCAIIECKLHSRRGPKFFPSVTVNCRRRIRIIMIHTKNVIQEEAYNKLHQENII